MNIQTARCSIRAFQREELDAFMEYRNNLEWMRYQGFKGLTKERYEQELFLNQSLDNGRQYAIINRTTGQLIGDVYLKREQTICWIGYTIHPRFEQQGYAQEAVRALICWASEQGFPYTDRLDYRCECSRLWRSCFWKRKGLFKRRLLYDRNGYRWRCITIRAFYRRLQPSRNGTYAC